MSRVWLTAGETSYAEARLKELDRTEDPADLLVHRLPVG